MPLTLTACAHMPQLFWPENGGGGSQPVTSDTSDGTSASSRQPLVVPPDLRGQVSVPMPDKVASSESSEAQALQAKEKTEVAGTAVALDTRVYDQDTATLFSAVVDAMTALNMPVQSVDSPSGTITTDWVRKDANSANVFSPIMSMFGAGGSNVVRYRFTVRVLRLTTVKGKKSQLEIRTLGQEFENSHWVNKPLKEKISNNLFSAVGDQLAHQAQQSAPATPASPAPTAP